MCIAWVMPAGHAWHDGARTGMRVVSLNGRDPRLVPSRHPMVVAQLLRPNDDVFTVRVLSEPIAAPWARLSLWLTGGVFVLLGAVVLVRRPDTSVARLFALLTCLAGIALGVSPASGGPHPAWSIVVQFLSLLGLAASFPAFVLEFVERRSGRSRGGIRLFGLAGCVLLAGYLAALFIWPSLYSVVRVGFAVYLVAGILAALALLARKALQRRADPSVRNARLAFAGMACGTLPFVGFSLIPETVHGGLVPEHLTAALWIAIPGTFAYGILRHRLLGIRRLVHRGMVHGTATLALLMTMCFLVVTAGSLRDRYFASAYSYLVTAILLTTGILLFPPLRRLVRNLIDRFVYSDAVDSGTLVEAMHHDILSSERDEHAVAAMVKRMRDSLQLEAVVLYLGEKSETMRVLASAGSRAEEAGAFARPRLLDCAFEGNGLSEMRWNSDVLAVARLGTGSETLGFLLLGPKEKGEVFLQEELRLVETVAPILALAIRETIILAELREVGDRLTDAQEVERARLARDLHDGPLQKAVFLSSAPDAVLRNSTGVARELVAELRELCARLRPAILDDLGLVPALDWLLEQTGKSFMVTPHLSLLGMTEDERLAPSAELALFRITQEAVNNALKHGHATSIHVSLWRTINGVTLSVADDGTGLETSHEAGLGLGIRGMRERLRQIGGNVDIVPNENGRAGTTVRASIPHVLEWTQ